MKIEEALNLSCPELDNQPHGSGEAVCMQCGHNWVAVAPVGTTRLECPECHTEKGLWKFEFMPSVGQMVRECNCGNQLFYLSQKGIYVPTVELIRSIDKSLNIRMIFWYLAPKYKGRVLGVSLPI